jgi:hypothetical protein
MDHGLVAEEAQRQLSIRTVERVKVGLYDGGCVDHARRLSTDRVRPEPLHPRQAPVMDAL